MEAQDRLPDRALDYPFEQPRRSYLQLGARTLELPPRGADLGGRTPLLAYGANASPFALARKLADLEPTPLPLLRADLAGFDVVYSDHVSPYGAVPGTLHRSPGTTLTAFVAYPDGEQLRALTATEPNYELAALTGLDCRLEDGRTLTELAAYVSRHGPRLLDEVPVALTEVEAANRQLPALTQRQLQVRLGRISPP